MGLAYNGIETGYTLTQSVQQGPEYDPSGTDQLYTRIDIRTEFILNAALNPALVGETPAITCARIRHMLTAPRRSLFYAVGADYLINLPGGLDDANGPFPDPAAFNIVSLNQSTFVVTFAVTVRLTDCSGEGGAAAARGYLSLRWNQATRYEGSSHLCTKRTSGLLIISSRSSIAPDNLRGLVTPYIEPSFRRDESEYALDDSGLRYRFTFVDRELMRELPLVPTSTLRGNVGAGANAGSTTALRMSGSQIESVPLPGAIRRGSIHLRLEGSKLTHPRDLMTTAIGICFQRAREGDVLEAQTKLGSIVMIGGAFAEDLSDSINAVTVTMEWKTKPRVNRENGQKAEGTNWWTVGGAGVGGVVGGVLGGPVGAVVGIGVGGFLGNAAGNALGGGQGNIGGVGTAIAAAGVVTAQGKPSVAFPLDLKWVGKPLQSTFAGASVAPAVRGTADAVRMVAGALLDPCGAQLQETTLDPVSGDNASVGVNPDGSTTTIREIRADDIPDDTDGQYEDDGPGIWDEYTMRAIYQTDTGTRMLPPTDEDGESVPVKMHAKFSKLTVELTAERIGSPPSIPPGESSDPNIVFLTSKNVYDSLDVAANGVSEIYKCAIIYEYGVRDASKLCMAYPVPPFLQANLVKDLAVKAGMAIGGVIGGDTLQTSGDATANPFADGALQLGLSAFSGVSGSQSDGVPVINP